MGVRYQNKFSIYLIAFFQELRTQLEKDCEGDFINDPDNVQYLEEPNTLKLKLN